MFSRGGGGGLGSFAGPRAAGVHPTGTRPDLGSARLTPASPLATRAEYQVASSAVSAGLSPGATIGAVLLGHFIISLACALNGYVGCRYGINFPSYARTCFGIRGTYLAVICRAIAAIIWFGTQTYQGGQCVQVMLQAIWPSFKSFPNHLPANAHVTSSMLLCFFIFCEFVPELDGGDARPTRVLTASPPLAPHRLRPASPALDSHLQASLPVHG